MSIPEYKIYKAILRTTELIKECSQPDEPGCELWKKIYEFTDGEYAIVAESLAEDGKYVFMGLEDASKNKELHWMFEQDDRISVYDDRAEFDEVWDSGEYETGGNMYLNPEIVEIIERIGGNKNECGAID